MLGNCGEKCRIIIITGFWEVLPPAVDRARVLPPYAPKLAKWCPLVYILLIYSNNLLFFEFRPPPPYIWEAPPL